MTLDIPNLKGEAAIKEFDQRLRDEANEDLADIINEEPTSKTQIIAIYGKGGIGKSFTLANLSHMMAEQGKRVLLIGCDPKSDTTSLLFCGKACPTIIETSTKKKLAGEEVQIGDVCFKRGGVFAMELGGPEVGRGCGGRGIIHGFELLEKLGFHDWDFDYVLLDFLGDVVCGGVGLVDTDEPLGLSLEDIERVIEQYRRAALNAREAGFEGSSCIAPVVTCRCSSWRRAARPDALSGPSTR